MASEPVSKNAHRPPKQIKYIELGHATSATHMCKQGWNVLTVLFKQLVWKGTYGMITCLQGLVVPMAHPSQSEYPNVHYPNTLIPFCLMEYVRAEYLAGTCAMHGCTIRRALINGILLKWWEHMDGNLSPRLSSPPWLQAVHTIPTLWSCPVNMWEQNMKILGLQSSGYSSLLMPSHFFLLAEGEGGLGGSLTLT